MSKKIKLLILSFKLFWKNIVIYFLLWLQLLLSIQIYMGIIGELKVVYHLKEMVSTLSNTDHLYVLSPFIIYGQNRTDMNWRLDISEMEGIENIGIFARNACLFNDKSLTSMEYGDLLLKNMKVKMASGQWFNTSSISNSEYVPIVTVGTRFKVGQIIKLEQMDKNVFSAKVIGTINSETKLLKLSAGGTDISFSDIITKCDCDIILPYDHLPHSFVSDTAGASLLLKTSSKLDDKKVADLLNSYGSVSSMKKLKMNYVSYINRYFKEYGIILSIFFIVSSIGTAGINGIINAKNKKRYSIYFILGLSRWECAFVEAVRSGILMVATFIGSVFISCHTNFLSKMDSNITVDWKLFIALFFYIVLIYVITSGYYIFKITRSNLIEIYKYS